AEEAASERTKDLLEAVGDALYCLAGTSTRFTPEAYRLQPALSEFFAAAQRGALSDVLLRNLASALGVCSAALRQAEGTAAVEHAAMRCAERALRRTARRLLRKAASRPVQHPHDEVSPHSLVASLTAAPSAPPHLFQF